MRSFRLVFSFVVMVLLTACAGAIASTPTSQIADTEAPIPSTTPFPMSSGLFTGDPQDFLLRSETLSGYSAQDAGFASDNARVIDLRADGQAYVEATGRKSGWQIQFDRVGEGDGPSYIVQVVNIFEQADGPSLAISPLWQSNIYEQFETGGLNRITGVEGLDGKNYLMWQDANGSVGLQIVYRNLLLFYTGPYESEADALFFARLALAHMAWIMDNEQ